jgi:hypothetical protein
MFFLPSELGDLRCHTHHDRRPQFLSVLDPEVTDAGARQVPSEESLLDEVVKLRLGHLVEDSSHRNGDLPSEGLDKVYARRTIGAQVCASLEGDGVDRPGCTRHLMRGPRRKDDRRLLAELCR